jgi:hypothetical protein
VRTWGRVAGTTQWVEVSTDAQGGNDYVWITTLAQCLKMDYGESPFFGNYGIPAHLTVVTQVQPDFYVQQTQQQFAPYFAALNIAKLSSFPPTYRVNVVTHAGTAVQFTTGVPQ